MGKGGYFLMYYVHVLSFINTWAIGSQLTRSGGGLPRPGGSVPLAGGRQTERSGI